MTMGTTSTVDTVSAVVDMGEFVIAAGAVAPHAGKEKDGRAMDRVRFILDPGQMSAAIAACCPSRAAVAIMPVAEAGDWRGRRVEADVTPQALRVMSRVFDAAEQGSVRIDMRLTDTGGGHWRALSVQATDVSGMIPGRTVRVMALPEWGARGARRADAVALVLASCASAEAGAGAFTIQKGDVAAWARTARVLGGLPLVVVEDDRVLVRYGCLTDARGLVFLATGATHGAGPAATGAPGAYEGPALEVLMGMLLDGGPEGGRRAEGGLADEIEQWVLDGLTESAASAPSGDEAA